MKIDNTMTGFKLMNDMLEKEHLGIITLLLLVRVKCSERLEHMTMNEYGLSFSSLMVLSTGLRFDRSFSYTFAVCRD